MTENIHTLTVTEGSWPVQLQSISVHLTVTPEQLRAVLFAQGYVCTAGLADFFSVPSPLFIEKKNVGCRFQSWWDYIQYGEPKCFSPLCSSAADKQQKEVWSSRLQKWLYERFGVYIEDFRFQPEESTVETEEPLSAKRWVRAAREQNHKCLPSGIDSTPGDPAKDKWRECARLGHASCSVAVSLLLDEMCWNFSFFPCSSFFSFFVTATESYEADEGQSVTAFSTT